MLDREEGTRYDAMEIYDRRIAERVYDLSEKYQVSMANICLAWQYAKGVASPIIGITKQTYLDDAVNCFNVRLTTEDVAYLDELYVPHPITCNR